MHVWPVDEFGLRLESVAELGANQFSSGKLGSGKDDYLSCMEVTKQKKCVVDAKCCGAGGKSPEGTKVFSRGRKPTEANTNKFNPAPKGRKYYANTN